MSGSLIIDLFGPIRVLVDGEAMPRLRSRKALWLLALLALRSGRPASREWVADSLWPDAEGGQGLANLRPLISELRTALGAQGDRLRVSDGMVSLDLEHATVDVVEFDAAIKRGDLAGAVQFYKGQLLEGCPEEWVFQEQRARETGCVAALQDLGEAALKESRPQEAVAYFTRAIGVDALRDVPRRGLMRALAAAGDVNAALQAYREFARHLSAEVSTVPDKETTRLYDRLRADLKKPPNEPAKPTPNNLIHPLDSMVGREDEVSDVAALLRKSRLVTLTGVGGIGKTRLALSVAVHVLSEHPGGVWFVALEAQGDERAVTAAVAGVLDVRDVASRPLVAGIVERLREGRCLIILDNCEHLLDPVADIATRLLKECPDLHILTTTREVINMPGEVMWSVPALAYPTEQSLPAGRATRRRVAEGFESIQLFLERAKAVQPTFGLDDDNLESIIDVCRQVEGLPLGIELAAARVRSMPVTALSERLADHHLETLLGHGRGQNPRQLALRATIDWSYALLQDEDRILMSKLAVFAGGWTLEAAESLCGTEHTAQGLQSLVEKSIIAFDERTKRYRFLETVRQYAAEKLAESGDPERIHARHREWCTEFAERARPGFRSADQAEWMHLADQEWPNLRKALDAGDRNPNLALRLAGAVWYYWYIRSARDHYRYLKETLDREGADDPGARAEVLLGLGVTTYSDADYDAARVLLNESLAIFESIDDKRGSGRVLTILGNLAHMVETYEKAVDLYERSLVLLREAGDLSTVAQTIGNLAMLAAQRDDYERAHRHYEEGLRLARELGTDRSLAYMLIGYANMGHRQGDGISYADYEQEALDLFRGLGDKRGAAVCLRQQGVADWRRGLPASAILRLEESRELFQEVGDPREEAHAMAFLARAVMDTGDLNNAETLLRDALSVLHPSDSHGIGDCNYVLSMILHRNGDLGQAWVCLLQTLTLWSETNNRSGIADALDLVAEHAASLCEDEFAATMFGVTEALRDEIAVHRIDLDEPEYQRFRALVRGRLGDAGFDKLAEAGRALSWTEAVARAKDFGA